MKFTTYIITFFLNLSFVFGQEITVKEESKSIEKVTYTGYETTVNGDFEKHKDEWTKLLKNKGKVRKRNLLYFLEDFVFPQITEKLLTGVTQINQSRDSIVSIWLGIDSSDLESGESSKVMNEISGMLYSYVLEYRKSLILFDIQNAERAAAFTSRQHQRLIQNLDNLKLRLLDAENEKLRLEESVKSMELEIEVLKQRIENNQADQERTYEELEQIRKVLEMHKEKLKKLN